MSRIFSSIRWAGRAWAEGAISTILWLLAGLVVWGIYSVIVEWVNGDISPFEVLPNVMARLEHFHWRSGDQLIILTLLPMHFTLFQRWLLKPMAKAFEDNR
jgi:hypothetical protein